MVLNTSEPSNGQIVGNLTQIAETIIASNLQYSK
jgi:hypothetical protein